MKNKGPLEKKIEQTILPTVESMGFEIVDISIHGQGRPTLDIMADKADGTKITLDECGKLSQAVSAVLDVENVMKDKAYFLEVGSPGIDRPLTKLKDFERFAGQEAKVETDTAIDGRKRFKGTLKGIEGDDVVIEVEGESITIPSAYIEKAKLLVSNTLLANERK